MSISPSITLDIESTLRDFKHLGDKAINQAAIRALNKAGKSAEVAARKEIRKIYNVTNKRLMKSFSILKAGRSRLSFRILARGRRISLAQFGAKAITKGKGRRKGLKGVSIRVLKSGPRKKLKAFLKVMPSTGHVGVFNRKGKSRLKIVERTGVSVPQMFKRSGVQKVLTRRAVQVFEPEFRRLLTLDLNRRARRGRR